MSGLQAQQAPSSVTGRWRIFARPIGEVPLEITFVREVPITVGSWEFGDPFGPVSGSLTFPMVTLLDRIGEGELAWLKDGTDVDIVWDGPVPAGYPDGEFRWEGYMTSFDYSLTGLTVALKGAMQQLDNYLAKPEYLQRPIPYEVALARQWAGRPDLRVLPLQIEWPSWWVNRYTPVPKQLSYLIPAGVDPGDLWTGLVTRQTGSWEPVLTNYMQTLLASMYTDRGRWTIDLSKGRRAVLRHRDFKTEPDATTLIIDPITPGVEVQLSSDPSQSLNVVYGQGTSFSGEAFTGQQVSADGLRVSYEPLAALRQVHPVSDKNGWLQPSRMRKEVLLQVQQGLDLQEAKKVGAAQLAQFSDPGLTGSISLASDPIWGAPGYFLPRALIKAGMSVQLKNALGRPEGVTLHITSVSTDLESGRTTLTVDSKYRDRLTVDEVRARGRDALSISRLLIAGQFQPPLEDQLIPWNYAQGSGYIPSGDKYSAVPLFKGMPDDIVFPWEDWTRSRPPRSKAWANCYIKIGPADYNNSDNNWGRVTRQRGGQFAFPIKMAQAGSIRLIQIAAYDINGNVLKVPFHIGLYQLYSTSAASMPMIKNAAVRDRVNKNKPRNYKIGQHYPFFPQAFDNYNLDGTQRTTEETTAVSSAGLVRAWGTDVVPAGYWPGTKNTGDPVTGLLVDEATWQFNLNDPSKIDPYSTTQTATDAGYLYCMIYCDEQEDQDVYFTGRMFRAEPGTTT